MSYETIMMYRILIVGLIALCSSIGALADPISHSEIAVRDGDTIRARGVTYRLVGYDTPEITSRWRSVGPDERAVALIAKERFGELIRSGSLDLQPVPCSCSQAKIAKGLCNHRRKCAILLLDGANVGEKLISEELAVPFVCGAEKCPRMPDWPKIIDAQSR